MSTSVTVRADTVSQPLGNETSQGANARLACTVTDFLGDPGRVMARAILGTMSRNLLTKIEYSSLVMRQVNGRRPELITFIVTKEHRRFTEFANAVRKERTIGICHGNAGVGKTCSAHRLLAGEKSLASSSASRDRQSVM